MANAHLPSKRIQIQNSINGTPSTSRKHAEHYVSRCRAVWVDANTIRFLEADYRHESVLASTVSRQRHTPRSANLDVTPAPAWRPGHLTEWGGAVPINPEWLQRMGYALEFGT